MQTINQRRFLAANARARESLGVPAAYGAPVMMPPTNRLGGALQIASQVASIYSGFGGGPLSFGGPKLGPLGNPLSTQTSMFTGIPAVLPSGAYGVASDIKLKENIKKVGVSPQGYKIYEFNYKGSDVRFRGAMAQDVRLKNPMAVGINVEHMYLTVDYDKIDIDMEVV